MRAVLKQIWRKVQIENLHRRADRLLSLVEMTPWGAYRAANPMLVEMREYNSRVLDRVLAKKTKKLTAPRDVMDSKIQVVDRYSALGMKPPDQKTMCKGDCEGTGLVPIKGQQWQEKPGAAILRQGESPRESEYQQLWLAAEEQKPTDDGWHFVKCLDCGGSGKRVQDEKIGSSVSDLRQFLR